MATAVAYACIPVQLRHVALEGIAGPVIVLLTGLIDPPLYVHAVTVTAKEPLIYSSGPVPVAGMI